MSSTDEVQAALAAIRQGMGAGRLAHAYLVIGDPRGNAGRFADEMLALLYCSAPAERPCRKCAGCRRALQHSHPDLIWVEPQKKSRTIQMEQVAEVQQRIMQTSLEGGWKAAVLVHAERLNETAANKLLKILEEPPAKCMFLLLSGQPEFLLPTIVSRCQRVALAGGTAEVESALKAAVLGIVTGPAEPGTFGGFARARRLLELFKALKDEARADEEQAAETELLGKMGKMDEQEASGRADVDAALREELEEAIEARIEGRYRERRTAVLRWLLFWHRDLLFSVCGLGADLLYFGDEAKQAAAGLTYRQALANLRSVEEMKDQLEQSLPENMVLERGMASLNKG